MSKSVKLPVLTDRDPYITGVCGFLTFFFKTGGNKKIMKIREILGKERCIQYIDIIVHITSI
jgi:hypothetical protein